MNGLEFLHHFLVMASALFGVPCPNPFAHQDMNFLLPPVGFWHFDVFRKLEEELDVAFLFDGAPVILQSFVSGLQSVHQVVF